MLNRIRRVRGAAADNGQSTIMFAVMAFTILLTTGVAVEGGRIFVEYRRLQSAADMSAIVGAQDLPLNFTQAYTDACNYAAQNGFDNCTGSGNSQTNVCIPPQSKAPYQWLNFIYPPSQNTTCGAATQSGYIETQISENLGVVPVFNVNVNLYAHAVARHGTPSPRDYALSVLDPTMKGALSFGGNANPAFIMVGPAIVNSTNSNAIANGSKNYNPLACDGTWFTSANELTPNQSGSPAKGLESNNSPGGSLPMFAPPDCYGGGQDSCTGSPIPPPVVTVPDCPVAFQPNSAPVRDPYCSSYTPPTDPASAAQTAETDLGLDCSSPGITPQTTMSNCDACNPSTTAASSPTGSNTAWYYQWNTVDGNNDVDRGATVATCPNTGAPVSCQAPQTAKGDGWHQVPAAAKFSPSGCCYELFPGYYPMGIDVSSNNATLFINPGVYTLDGDFKISGGSTVAMCVYGAPICDRTVNNAATGQSTTVPGQTYNCSTANFGSSPTSTYFSAARTWYYYCSPWGTWDSNACLGYTGPAPCTAATCPGAAGCTRPSVLQNAPYFIDRASSYASPIPMNGATFYFRALTSGGSPAAAGGFKMTGNGNQYLAFPNSCPGTGTGTSDTSAQTGSGAVDFGSNVFAGHGLTGIVTTSGTTASGVYKYPATSLASIDGHTDSGSSWVYPSADMTTQGECVQQSSNTSAGTVWKNEFGTYPQQHLHFLVFDRGMQSPVMLTGSGNQNWWGILYDWYNTTPCGGNACMESLAGGSGGSSGPPLLIGQVIGDNVSVTGSSTAEVFYRPCPGTGMCLDGPGSNLIQ